MYENTWIDYEAKYKSLALYKTLLEVESELAQSQAKLTRWQQQKNELQGKMQAAQGWIGVWMGGMSYVWLMGGWVDKG